MRTGAPLTLLAPLAGWSAPLDEVPDEVFAARLMGDGVAIDPTASTLYAPNVRHETPPIPNFR